MPPHVPESKVPSIADLTRPEVAERMPDTIVSLPEATGLTVGARRVMDAYNLEDAGYELVAAAQLNGWARSAKLSKHGNGSFSRFGSPIGERRLRYPSARRARERLR